MTNLTQSFLIGTDEVKNINLGRCYLRQNGIEHEIMILLWVRVDLREKINDVSLEAGRIRPSCEEDSISAFSFSLDCLSLIQGDKTLTVEDSISIVPKKENSK